MSDRPFAVTLLIFRGQLCLNWALSRYAKFLEPFWSVTVNFEDYVSYELK